jgi:hypothetical protein
MPSPFDSPLGSTPFGCGTPLPAGPPPTGYSGLCRFIDGFTGDYAIDPVTGHLAAMPVVRQRVLLALLTVRGSSSVLPTMGMRRPSKIGSDTAWAMAAEARVALSHMTDVERVLRVDNLTVEQVEGSGRVRIICEYTDLTTGQPDKVST